MTETIELPQTRKRVIFVVISDTHGDSKLALMNPHVVLYTEDEKGNLSPYNPKPTATQGYLYELYQENIQQVIDLANGAPIVVLHNGDLCQGIKHPNLLVSDRLSDQVAIGVANMQPWLEIPNVVSFRFAIGTAAHNFNFGSAELLVFQQLQAMYPAKDIGICYHGLIEINGVTIDFAHHGPGTGIRDWLKGNVARFYLKDLMYQEVIHGNDPPDLVLRAHFHDYTTEVVRLGEWQSRIVITPSYSLLTDHDVQATRSVPFVKNGLVAFEITDGHLSEPFEFMKTIDTRTRETIL